MSEIRTEIVAITTTGSAGSATGSGDTPSLSGWFLDVYFNYHASCPATADVTVAYKAHYDPDGDSIPSFGNLIVVSNNATDGLYAPRQDTHDEAATGLGNVDLYPLNGPLTISVAQADALTDCVIAYVRYLKI
jgi:hypothetical protein